MIQRSYIMLISHEVTLNEYRHCPDFCHNITRRKLTSDSAWWQPPEVNRLSADTSRRKMRSRNPNIHDDGSPKRQPLCGAWLFAESFSLLGWFDHLHETPSQTQYSVPVHQDKIANWRKECDKFKVQGSKDQDN